MQGEEVIIPKVGDVWEDIDTSYLKKFGKMRELTVKKMIEVVVNEEKKLVIICGSNIRRINATVSIPFLNRKFRLKSRKANE